MEYEPLVVVTGAAGLIGRYVLQRLKDQGFSRIRILSRSLEHSEGVDVVTGDLQSPDALLKLVEEAHYVLHCAGEVHDASKMQSVNRDATIAMATLAAEAGVKRFCNIRSDGDRKSVVVGKSVY